jgi:hypothetical protein
MIKNASFWQRYTTAVALRNKIVHKGKVITKKEAEDACAAYAEVIQHIELVFKKM